MLCLGPSQIQHSKAGSITTSFFDQIENLYDIMQNNIQKWPYTILVLSRFSKSSFEYAK